MFVANGLAGLKSREVDGRDEKITALEKARDGAGSIDLAGDQRGVREESGLLAPGKSTS